MNDRGPARFLGIVLFVVLVGGLTAYEISTARRSADSATAQMQPPAAPAPAAAPPAAPEVAAVNPADVAPAPPPAAAKPEAPAPLPSFDVVRVEPSGETVVAGQADPEAKVEVLDGTAPIATAEADQNGEWAMAVEKPLAPGTHDLAVRMTDKAGTTQTLSDQRVTVSVPEKGSKDVLVVMNTPDSASRILQVPAAPAPAAPAATGEQVAAAPPAAATESPAATAEAAPAATAEAAPAAGAQPETQTAEAAAPQMAVGAAGGAPETGNQIAATEPPLATEAPIAGEAPVAGEPQIAAEAPVQTEAPIKAEPPVATEQLAKVEPPKPEVAVAAVEADTSGSVYIAGTAKTGETVRIYLDDKPLGEAQPSPSGTWLVETRKDLPAGNYTVRADQVDNSGTVIARSEVPFEREVEVAILKPTGAAGAATGEGGATLSGAMPEMETVIIKRGDNLWRIARGAWGKGMRWSTIYQANTDQIRDPHWIYPGQVFIMPKGSVTWTD